jgi:hypothetical protein
MEIIKSLLFWKGRKKGIIHTTDIGLDDIRAVFFPKNFYEKYRYLGSVPYYDFKELKALVIIMDYEAKPKYCPRWFLRFLHLFGSDNSVVRVRNRRLHNLLKKLTKGIFIYDYKTKWTDYDIRISVTGPEYICNLADAIENDYYKRGREAELVSEILKLNKDAKIIYGSISRLEKQLNELKEKFNIE